MCLQEDGIERILFSSRLALLHLSAFQPWKNFAKLHPPAFPFTQLVAALLHTFKDCGSKGCDSQDSINIDTQKENAYIVLPGIERSLWQSASSIFKVCDKLFDSQKFYIILFALWNYICSSFLPRGAILMLENLFLSCISATKYTHRCVKSWFAATTND